MRFAAFKQGADFLSRAWVLKLAGAPFLGRESFARETWVWQRHIVEKY